MCILKTNQEKLLWYLNDNHAPPCLSMDFERIERSTAMTRDEITAFYRYISPIFFNLIYPINSNISRTRIVPALD